jgi:hypothetical protein
MGSQDEPGQGPVAAAQPEAAGTVKAAGASSHLQDTGEGTAPKKALAAEAPKGGAKKAAGKGKSAAAQRGIMSFFAKKPS